MIHRFITIKIKAQTQISMKSFVLALTLSATKALSVLESKYMNYLAKFGKTMNDVEEF